MNFSESSKESNTIFLKNIDCWFSITWKDFPILKKDVRCWRHQLQKYRINELFQLLGSSCLSLGGFYKRKFGPDRIEPDLVWRSIENCNRAGFGLVLVLKTLRPAHLYHKVEIPSPVAWHVQVLFFFPVLHYRISKFDKKIGILWLRSKFRIASPCIFQSHRHSHETSARIESRKMHLVWNARSHHVLKAAQSQEIEPTRLCVIKGMRTIR